MNLDLQKQGLEDALKLADNFTQSIGVSAELRLKFRLIYEELASNVFTHSKRRGATFLNIDLDYRDGKIYLKMDYDGPPFDPTSFHDKRMAQSPCQRTGGGWGLHLVKQLAQTFTYKRVGEVNRIYVEVKGQ